MAKVLEKDILSWAEKNVVPIVKEMNDKRCLEFGISYPQEQPLPGVGEDIRAFYIRIKGKIIKYKNKFK